MSLRLYNTLTRRVQPFEPLRPPAVAMYVCGPTVYDVPHIGHARSAYVFDVLRRYLASQKFEVTFVRNVTDVDDKIIDKARQEVAAGDLNATCRELAERYFKVYKDTMGRLGIAEPTREPKATEHVVPDMTDFISTLLLQGVAYEAGGDVYFSVRKSPGYGKLSNRALDDLQAGSRVEPGEHPGPPGASAGAGKQDPLDFALWKSAKPGEPSWDSPWGKGRPGWHIECSTMSTKLLGDAFDIHGGGVDLVFPHHENELAQAQAAGKPFARCWVHNGLLTVNGEKMSKSAGNFITVEEALNDWPHSDYLKIFFLKTHYRSPIDYSAERMAEAKRNREEFSRFFQHYHQRKTDELAKGKSLGAGIRIKERFLQAMDDDLNTPSAVAALIDGVNLGQGLLTSSHPDSAAAAKSFYDALIECGAVLGLFLEGLVEEAPQVTKHVSELIVARDAARKTKDYSTADRIRKQLQEEGVLLTDTVNGTIWHRVR